MLFSPAAMHIPDGFLTPAVSALGWLLAAALILIALRQTRRQLGERQIPVMGVLAAFIFAAQAINFPVAGGTSGHLLGGTLAAIVMGPWAAALIMTAVIAVQGLVFQDGGLLVMGWNIFNMGVVTAFTGYAAYMLARRLAGGDRAGRLAGAVAGAWLSVEAGAIATAFELAFSGTTPLALGLPAMAGVHALIGIGEAIITAGAVGFLQVSRPALLQTAEAAPGRRGAWAVVGGLLMALALALASPLASRRPDGLAAVAQRQGFAGRALAVPFGLASKYRLPFIGDAALATIAAVAVGTLLVFGVALALGRAAARR